jgi:hypothetical protein
MNKNTHKAKIPSLKLSSSRISTENFISAKKTLKPSVLTRKISPVSRFRKMTFHQDAENLMKLIEAKKNLSSEFRSPLSNLNITMANELQNRNESVFDKAQSEIAIETKPGELSDLKRKVSKIEIEKRESLARQSLEKQELEKRKTSFGFLPIYD